MKIKKVLGFIFAFILALGIASCNPSSSSSSTSTSQTVDYVSQTKLVREYKGKDFLTDGIGEVTLKTGVDGDTAHFYCDGKFIAGRFNGINTPESTGIIEPWGKKASKFTTKSLEEAKTIVLESESNVGGPEQDGNKRYLVWVWISSRTPDVEDGSQLRLLNLILVQEGYGKMQGVSVSKYKDVFLNADAQAQAQKVKVWSDTDPDFDYSGVYTETTLMNIMTNPTEWIGKKVQFEGVVSRTINTDAYVQKDFPLEDGTIKTFGLYVFTQYKARDCLSIGNLLQLKGEFATYNGNYQLVDISYNAYFQNPADTIILEKNHVVTPMEVTVNDVNNNPEMLGVLVTIKGLTATGGYGGLDSGAETNGITVYTVDADGNKLNIRIDKGAYIRDENGERIKSFEYFEGKTFDITGVMGLYESQYDGKIEYQLMLIRTTDLVINA
ncbi:MAG: thermonuclease family protein [Bacilli bacterium]|nr:thermonuclease family protein [Bacilli bacterium]